MGYQKWGFLNYLKIIMEDSFQTQNAISNTKIPFVQITYFPEKRLFWAQTYTHPAFPKKLLYDHSELHHWCPALALQAAASEHCWDAGHARAWKYGLCVTVLYVLWHRAGKKPEAEETNVAGKASHPDMACRQMSWLCMGLVFNK